MAFEELRHESGCRLPLVQRNDLPSDAQVIFDQAQTPSSKSLRGLRGPAGITLHSARLAVLSRPVGRFLRFESGIAKRTREVAILVTARTNESRFEWVAHEEEALKVGVPRETIETIRSGGDPDLLDVTDALIILLGRAIFQERAVSSNLYTRLIDKFGTEMLINIVALMGNYAATALMLSTFDMRLDEDVQPPF